MLGHSAASRPITGIGIDLSAAAAEFAARRFPALTWVVANADRRLPLLDGSVDLVLSIHGRRNPPECARVLTAHGLLFVVLPAPDDLIELRTLVQGPAIERDRVDAMLGEHRADFEFADRFPIRRAVDARAGGAPEAASRHLSWCAIRGVRASRGAAGDGGDAELGGLCAEASASEEIPSSSQYLSFGSRE